MNKINGNTTKQPNRSRMCKILQNNLLCSNNEWHEKKKEKGGKLLD